LRVLSLILTLGIAACGNLTGGGIGEATVAVTGNEPGPAPSASYAAASEPIAPTSDEADEAEGQVRVRFLVSLVSESGSETQLGENELEVEVDLQGADEPEVVTQVIPAVRYTELRLVFTEIKAEVQGGLVINGIPIIGELHVELQDVSLLVTRPIDLDVNHGEQVRVLVDLNAPAWLTAVDPITLAIDETVFAGLVNVVIP
jgi:hypothetical protein